MNRPFIFCHMLTSADGRIHGNYMPTPELKDAEDVFYDLAFGRHAFYRPNAWICGRVTTEDMFTEGRELRLDEGSETVPAGDFINTRPYEDFYYIALDSRGVIGWDKDFVRIRGKEVPIIEVLTDQASDAYKAYLRKLGISYIICGSKTVHYDTLLEKLSSNFDIDSLMLGGGGVLNWSFIQRGLCDEVSLVMAPVADGNQHAASVFETSDRFSTPQAVGFQLLTAEVRKGGTAWLRYSVNNRKID